MIIMEAILSASALLHGRAAQSVGRSVVRTFKRWRAAYTAWHRERRASALHHRHGLEWSALLWATRWRQPFGGH
jgi:hypothetical protein